MWEYLIANSWGWRLRIKRQSLSVNENVYKEVTSMKRINQITYSVQLI